MKVFLQKCKTEQIDHFLKIYNISKKGESTEYKEEIIREYWEKNGIGDCPICLERIEATFLVITPCLHLFCDTCLLEHLKKNESCPICRQTCIYNDIIIKIIANGLNLQLIKNLTKKQEMVRANTIADQIIVVIFTVVISTVMAVAVIAEVFFIISITCEAYHFMNKIYIKLIQTEDRMI
jgi:hypothetical protein|uniref:RING-type domain-containing protein n=1 Tax=viral metagenome TaxID=1070528 RepID=A0A6C0DX19_9ZZZZ